MGRHEFRTKLIAQHNQILSDQLSHFPLLLCTELFTYTVSTAGELTLHRALSVDPVGV